MLDKTDGQQVAQVLSASSLIKVGPGRVVMVSTLVTGTGTLHDAASIGAASGVNIIAAVSGTVGTEFVNMPFINGLVYVPAGGQIASISYN